MNLAGKLVVVTGGGQGLGAALARRFAADGAHVVVLDVNAESVGAVADAIGAQSFTCDVGDREQLDATIDTIEGDVGPIDLFCSNAAVFGGDASTGLAGTADDLWAKAIDVNLMSHVWAATKLVPAMEARGGGYFLQVLSAAGLITGPSTLSYTVTKHAGIGFAEWLSINHRHNGIKVSCLCPTAVATPQLALPAANAEDARIRAQLGLIQTPDEVADITVRGLDDETFLILPNERVGTSFLHKAQDYDRWLDHTARRVTAMRGRVNIFDLTGKVAVVTGGSRGIGRSIAQGFAEAGADVVIASRTLEACRTAASEIASVTGRRTEPVACHVGRWSDCDMLADTVYEMFGRCDVLVNNAGMSPLYPDLPSITEAYYDKVASVNLKGPFRLSSVIGSRMARGAGGGIINVSTIGSLRPSATELVYACAKAGLNALTIGLAEAFGPTVRANAILPGAIATDIAKAWSPEMTRQATDGVPLQRMGTAADFVGTALWLASDASAFVTGELVRVDGGAYRQTN